ncbi:MAG: glycosyltransferase family 8 protein [Aristaeellaceae bacterium]
MNVFVTLDRNYLNPLRVMLGSMFLNNPGECFDMYIAADGIAAEDLHGLEALCLRGDVRYHFLEIQDEWFADAPTVRYYSRAMYYRLLAAQLLPESIDRILYLDPDILVIGSLRPLYELELGDQLYAAAMHRGLIGISAPMSRLRLPDYEADSYFNSGVLLMNLPQIRREVRPQDVFDYVEKNRAALILPDQDVLNGLYGARILPVDESIWNYDARKYQTYLMGSQRRMNMDWIMRNTAILHFCGKDKPWNPSCRNRFSVLYRHYQSLIARICADSGCAKGEI